MASKNAGAVTSQSMRLHFDPASTTCRPVILFAAEANIPLEMVRVDLFSGEHQNEAFTRFNPNQAVPVLEHDGFVLTESSAILKYLADLIDSPAYPKELRARARVNEMMDWFNTSFMRDFCYGVLYARILSHYRLPEPGFSQALAIHEPRARKRLKALDAWIGAKPFICGSEISLADYFGSGLVSSGELIDFDFRPWPNVLRWLNAMESRPMWDEVHAAFYGWKSAVSAQMKASG